jgi:hypothetical protein
MWRAGVNPSRPGPSRPAELRECHIEQWTTPAERAAHTYRDGCQACQPRFAHRAARLPDHDRIRRVPTPSSGAARLAERARHPACPVG